MVSRTQWDALLLVCAATFTCVFLPNTAQALLPPDLLFSVTSQAAQILALLSAVFISITGAFLPAITSVFQKTWVRYAAFALCMAALLALWSWTLLSLSQPKPYSGHVPPGFVSGTTTGATPYETGYRYQAERFVFVGYDTKGSPLVFEISANRQEQKGGGYLHYYIADTISKGAAAHEYQSKLSPDDTVLSSVLFTSYARIRASDHSTRERIEFSATVKGAEYIVKSGELSGDFIVKNEPEYTEFMSVADADVTVRGEVVHGHLLYQRAYSTDYRQTVFFPGFETLSSQSSQVVVWDEQGTFYLVDKSDVHEYNPAYSSHVWALAKNTDGTVQKAFDGTLVYTKGSFTGAVPAFGIQSLEFSLQKRFAVNYDAGFGTGFITDARGTRTVIGFGSYQIYGN